MVQFTDTAGLPIHFCGETGVVKFEEQVSCRRNYQVALQDIRPSLLNAALRYPEVVYDHHESVLNQADSEKWPHNQRYDVMYIPAGLLGIEFNKSHIYFAENGTVKAASVVHVFSGELTIILQKNHPKQDRFDMQTRVAEAMQVTVGEDEKVVVPAGYYYTFVNATEEPVIFGRLIANEHVLDYQLLSRERGLAYYLISKNARPELVMNPRYSEFQEVDQLNAEDLNQRVDMCGFADHQGPLYEEVKQEPRIFEQILLAVA